MVSDELLTALGPVSRSVDWLAAALHLTVPDVLARLARLETRGLVVRSGGLVMRRGSVGVTVPRDVKNPTLSTNIDPALPFDEDE
jgi:DNA-binding Lrp family transcriptional regulator